MTDCCAQYGKPVVRYYMNAWRDGKPITLVLSGPQYKKFIEAGRLLAELEKWNMMIKNQKADAARFKRSRMKYPAPTQRLVPTYGLEWSCRARPPQRRV